MNNDDDFVSDILGAGSESSHCIAMQPINASQSSRQPLRSPAGPTSPKGGYTALAPETPQAEPPTTKHQRRDGKGSADADTRALFRYALIFINFTFIVASLLMIMAGIVARVNSAVQLCDRCGDLTLVSIIFGAILWLFAMFGFNWIRQKNILLLLVYVGFLIVLFVVLLTSIIAGSVFSADIEKRMSDTTQFLNEWKESVARNASNLCVLQRRFNCSGFFYGCCSPYNGTSGTGCYGNETHPNDQPGWVHDVCPDCPFQDPAPTQCTNIVYGALKQNLGGFLVINCFSLFLVTTGIALSALARKVNQSPSNSEG